MRPVLHAQCPRARLRRTVNTPFEVVRLRDGSLVGSRVLDLSTRGMLLETDARVLTGEEMRVLFRGPSGDWYDVDGSVARILHGRRRGDRTRAVGIAFEPMDPWRDILLCDALKHSPLATRGDMRLA